MAEPRNDVEAQIAGQIERRVEEGVTLGVTIVVQVAVAFVAAVLVFKFAWAWVVPDLFPRAVDEGLIRGNLTWLTAVKLAVLVSVLSGLFPAIVEETLKRR